MKLDFEGIEIRSFLSIGSAELNFKNRGFTRVQGINNYEPKLDSNGSGKSAIFEAILWCLYGQTSRGLSNVSNEILKEPASVSLSFNLDNIHYAVTRKAKPSSLVIVKNDEDISGATYTKSTQILSEIFQWMDYDMFVSMIILSQGLPGKFSSLKPSARKSRLELLSGIDEQLQKLLDKVSKLYSDITTTLGTIRLETAQNTSKITTLESINNQLQSKIDDLSKMTPNIDEDTYSLYKAQVTSISEMIENDSKGARDLSTEINSIKMNSFKISSEISSTERSITDFSKKLESYRNSRCPECGSIIDASDKIKEISEKINEYKKLVDEHRKTLTNLLSEQELKSKKFEESNSSLELLNSKKSQLSSEISKYEMFSASTEGYVSQIFQNTKTITELNDSLNSLSEQQKSLDEDSSILSYCKTHLNKEFRTYLLESMISYMNSVLEETSKYLYDSQGVVHMESEKNNINIYLGDRSIEALSGGELRRVDLLLQLAQKSLCEKLSGFSCNLFVLDEILDFLDESGVENVISLLESRSVFVDTIMFVSHKPDLSINYDSSILVVKGEDQISQVYQS
jgi:DNA repair exonuclease SbcCD ATPase subunit